MPIVDYEARITSRFQCPRPQDAAPGEKHRHQLAAVYDTKTPHVRVDCVFGTRGMFVERVDHNWYAGHVPDAPVLLSPAQLETYRTAEAETGWGKKRVLALGAAALVGAALGLLATGAVLTVLSGLHIVFPAHFIAVTLVDWVVTIAAWSATGAIMCVTSDWLDWSRARGQFYNMRRMAECAVQLDANVRRPQEDADSAYLINFGRNSDNWTLQQAALELEAARARARLAPCQQSSAA